MLTDNDKANIALALATLIQKPGPTPMQVIANAKELADLMGRVLDVPSQVAEPTPAA